MKTINCFIIDKNCNTKNESIINNIMIKIGLIEKISSGIYIWLPIGVIILNKLIKIIKKELKKNNFIEINIPILQPIEIWKKSNRYIKYGKTLIKTDNKKKFILSPTNEEIVTILITNKIQSQYQLPKKIFQIQKKFRNETRNRSGIIRSKEFFMKDAYSFHKNELCLKKTYKNIYFIYKKIFKLLKINFFSIKTKNKTIGGNISHEFHILSKFGENKIEKKKKHFNYFIYLNNIQNNKKNIKNIKNINIINIININIINIPFFFFYKKKKKSIEIAHIFKIGEKYSKIFNSIIYINNKKNYIQMGCYGIGIDRLIVGIIEQNLKKNNFIDWPKKIEPFKISLININDNFKKNNLISNFIYLYFKKKKISILWDNRNINIKKKINYIKEIGIKKLIFINKNKKLKFINIKYNFSIKIKFKLIKDFFIKF